MKPEEMEKKLQIVEDRENIKRLQYSYINSLIANRWDEIVDYFTDDGEVDLRVFQDGGKIKGKEQIEKYFKDRIAKSHVGREGLFVVHPVIDVDGDNATGKWISYFMHLRSGGEDPMLDWMQGVYDCKYVRENNKWKFSLLKWRPRLKFAKPDMQYIENELI